MIGGRDNLSDVVVRSNMVAFLISKPDLVLGFFGEGTILTLGSILGFLEEELLVKAFLFSSWRLVGSGGDDLIFSKDFDDNA